MQSDQIEYCGNCERRSMCEQAIKAGTFGGCGYSENRDKDQSDPV